MKLIIEDHGFTFNLPKVGMIRTPCELEFSYGDISNIITTLKMVGISKYKIIEDIKHYEHSIPKNTKVIKAKKPDKVIIEKIKESDSNSIELTKLNKKFDKLLDGFNQLIEKGIEKKKPFTKTVYINNKPKIESIDEDDASFIPEIDLDGFEVSSSKSNEVYIESDDILSSASILRDLKGGGKE